MRAESRACVRPACAQPQTTELFKASNHQHRRAAWSTTEWTAETQTEGLCEPLYLLRLSRAQGMPVGVLKAGSSFSPNSTAFLRNTYEKKRQTVLKTGHYQERCLLKKAVASRFPSFKSLYLFSNFPPIYHVNL